MDERTMQTQMDSVASSTSPLNLEEGEQFKAGSSMYSMVKYLGEGNFGKVALWKDLHTNETVVVKILKQTSSLYLEKEVAILKAINALGPDNINVVRFHDRIDAVGYDGLIFEQLHINLCELLCRQDWCPLFPSEIRPIAVQMLMALDALKFLGVLHTDIKPDNIMLVGGEDQPFKVKLIDFGSALYAHEARPGDNIQALRCRAPEVYLGLQYNEAVDMWGLGCVLAYLYMACHLFPYRSPYKIVKGMVETLGLPGDHQLRAGMYTRRYFSEQAGDPQSWRLLSPEEYTAETNLPAEDNERYYEMPGGLDDLIVVDPDQDDPDLEDRRMFVDLLKGMLHMDGAWRLTPRQALQHPYFWTAPNPGECFDSGVNPTSCQFTGSSQDLWVPSGTQTLNAGYLEDPALLLQIPSVLYPPDTQQSAGYLEETEDEAVSSTPEPEGPPAAPPGPPSVLYTQQSAGYLEATEDDAASSTPEPEGPPAGAPGPPIVLYTQESAGYLEDAEDAEDDVASSTPEPEGPPAGPPGPPIVLYTQESAGYLEDAEDDVASSTPEPEGPPAGPPSVLYTQQSAGYLEDAEDDAASSAPEPEGPPAGPPSVLYTQQSAGYLEDMEDDAASSAPEPEGPPAGPPGRLRKTLKRVWRGFKGVKNFFCCCLRPKTDN